MSDPRSLVFLRHAPTDWNREGRLQGQRDLPLSAEGRAMAAQWRLPEAFQGLRVIASPLRRCLETAALMGIAPDEIDQRIMEASWGAWEGRRLADLRQSLGQAMVENEARGLDFRPLEGESPREVRDRLAEFLTDLAQRQEDHLLISHKGVLRALYSLATGWDMREKEAVKFERAAVQSFWLHDDASVTPQSYNLSL